MNASMRSRPLNNNEISREELREYLSPIYDLERLISKISYRSANPKDLLAFKQSLSMLPAIKYLLESFEGDTLLSAYGKDLDDLSDICGLITDAIDEEAPLTVREGKMIKSGYKRRSTGASARRWQEMDGRSSGGGEGTLRN